MFENSTYQIDPKKKLGEKAYVFSLRENVTPFYLTLLSSLLLNRKINR